ncbi:hypothetical protein [Brevundimonas sp.]|uniref:hypothetical protein n=1 Tax=Brevundimonas sp. TaxID=1871086 RepID=UPI0025C1B19D|nr:hypothetical protein [Brevundimonas sp.]
MSQNLLRTLQFAGVLLIAGGAMAFAVASLGVPEAAFLGLGVMAVLVGMHNLAQARKGRAS